MSTAPQRRQSNRPTRTAASRPTNYYARPFPSARAGAVTSSTAEDLTTQSVARGFFPALTHFTGSVTALPKEVMKHFSMLKEVEAKVFSPGEELEQLVDAFLGLSPPPSINVDQSGAFEAREVTEQVADGANENLCMNGDGFGKTDILPNCQAHLGLERQALFGRLHYILPLTSMLLDEKNAVLLSANQTLKKQIARMESSYIYIPSEVSDEARLGSAAHWAYTEKDTGKVTTITDRVRRDGIPGVASITANSAGGAVATSEANVAASRSEARREAVQARKNRNNRILDPDFDEAVTQKKSSYKAKKHASDIQVEGNINIGRGITGTSQPAKRRKTEKTFNVAPIMERSASNNTANRSRAITQSKDTSTLDIIKKKSRAAPSPLISGNKRRNGGTGMRSPQHDTLPIHNTVPDKNSRVEEKRPFLQKSGQEASNRAASTLFAGNARKRVSPTRKIGGSGITSPEASYARDVGSDIAQTYIQSDPKLPSDATIAALITEDAITHFDTKTSWKVESNDSRSSHVGSGAASSIPTLATIISSETFGTIRPPLSASTKTVPTKDSSHYEPDPNLVQQMSTRANQAASVSSKPNASSAQHAPTLEITAPPRARNTRNNGQRPSHPSRTGSASATADSAVGKSGNFEVAGTIAGAVGSTQLRRSHKKASGNGNDGAASTATFMPSTAVSGRVSKRGSTSSNQQQLSSASAGALPIFEQSIAAQEVTADSIDGTYDHANDSYIDNREGENTYAQNDIGMSPKYTETSPRHGSNEHRSTSRRSEGNGEQMRRGRGSVVEQDGGGGGSNLDTKSGDINNEEEEEGNDDDEDDEDEPRYCYCNQVSYGEMVACDNIECMREWFHLACVGLSRPPSSKSKWYCNECKDQLRNSRPGSSRY